MGQALAMEIEREKIAALLAREYPFQSLSREQLLSIADKFTTLTLAEGEYLKPARQVVKKFYVLFSGKLEAEILLRRGRKRVKNFIQADYFGDEFILTGSGEVMNIRALVPSVLLSLEPAQFEKILTDFPVIQDAMLHIVQSRRLASHARFKWLNLDESIFFVSRKHIVFLIRSLILPLIFIVVSIPMITIGAADSQWLLISGIVLLILGLLGFGWNWLDWGNDYYVVTNQRTLWIEQILLIYDSRDEALLHNVLSVDVFSTFFGQLFNYGDVSAKTYTGSIPMHNANSPYVLASFIEGMRKRAEVLFKEKEAQEIQSVLAEALRKHQAPEAIIPELPTPRPLKQVKKPQETKKPPKFFMRWRNSLKMRYEENGIITYRKSLWVLAWRIWIPVLLSLVWFWGAWQVYLIGAASSALTASLCFMLAIFIGLQFWLWYKYIDWRNDIYRLSPTQIFDIEKKPLGAEIRKSADIENILTITHMRHFIGVLLNFGNVVITVGETQFIFFDVYNPDRIHQDIANYQEALRQRKRRVEEARERERMLNWLVAYDKEAKKVP
jgi:CRP-like cAMP-binding protein